MIRKVLVATLLCAVAAAPAFAQARVEVSGVFGWTFSDGVPIAATPVNGITYNRVDPKDSQSFGLTFGAYVTPEVEVEFLWNRQMSQLQVRGNGPTLSADMNVDNFHGNFVYNFGERDTVVRPFVLAGLGATSYGDAAFSGRTVTGLSRFSWAIGGGVKAYPSKHVGVKAMMRWTPTHIKTEMAGWWCDPWFGCMPIGTAYYSNQFELSGGVTLRF